MSHRPPKRSPRPRNQKTHSPGYDPEAGVPRYLLEQRAKDGGAILNGAMLGAGIAILPSYFAAEASLSPFAHPIHWLGAVAATAAGMATGAAVAWVRARRTL